MAGTHLQLCCCLITDLLLYMNEEPLNIVHVAAQNRVWQVVSVFFKDISERQNELIGRSSQGSSLPMVYSGYGVFHNCVTVIFMKETCVYKSHLYLM